MLADWGHYSSVAPMILRRGLEARETTPSLGTELRDHSEAVAPSAQCAPCIQIIIIVVIMMMMMIIYDPTSS